jgi:hypothetical protein
LKWIFNKERNAKAKNNVVEEELSVAHHIELYIQPTLKLQLQLHKCTIWLLVDRNISRWPKNIRREQKMYSLAKKGVLSIAKRMWRKRAWKILKKKSA